MGENCTIPTEELTLIFNMMQQIFAAALIATASAVSLNGDTFDAGIAGKAAFIKFQAPW